MRIGKDLRHRKLLLHELETTTVDNKTDLGVEKRRESLALPLELGRVVRAEDDRRRRSDVGDMPDRAQSCDFVR